MRDSFLILLCFAAGLLLAHADFLPRILLENDPTLPALWVLMALVGLALGSDGKLAEILRSFHPAVLLLPAATTIGTFAGCAIAAFLASWGLFDCLAVGAGFAYYSLSSIFIAQYKGPDLGAVALICNIMRELFTLLFTPLVARFFGPGAAISCGGASTMDTTLPIISRYCGAAWILPSIIHATIMDLSVPLWVTFFCML